MTRFLAVVRRLFWAGTVSLILALTLFGIKFETMWQLALAHNSAKSWFCIFFLASPILFLLLTIISVIYIRHHGQFAAAHQSHSPVTSFFRCWSHDIVSPFKNIKNFFGALFNKNAIGRGILIGRFFELVVIVLLCVIGIGMLL